jgi:UDP-N-acetylglucosamine 4,6-dehydratase/5-epimerase
MKILITGGTGSLGSMVVRKLLSDEVARHQVFIYSRDEYKQAIGQNHERLTKIIGDVRDSRRLVEATRGMDMIMHFAALKRVDSLEENPEEAIHTNVTGTMNVLHAQRVNGIKRVILSSTDKAVMPINSYGATKLLSERLVLRNKSNVVCRYGNVMASRGSAIAEFKKTLLRDGSVNITDPRMTRFWITLDHASDFVIDSAFAPTGGLKIPEIRGCKVTEMAEAVAECLGVQDFDTFEIGMRPGEKLHEALYIDDETQDVVTSQNCHQLSKEDIKFLIEEAGIL